jgi:4-carboxymuconolactone decarboxylase
MGRLQKVGEVLRYRSSLAPKLNELVMLIVAREWTQQFEWQVHLPLAIEAGLDPEIAAAVAEGRRPRRLAEDEELAWDFCNELMRTRGVSDATYARAVALLGERGLIDLLGLAGYFTTVSMVMNVAHIRRRTTRRTLCCGPFPSRTAQPDFGSTSPLCRCHARLVRAQRARKLVAQLVRHVTWRPAGACTS